MDNLNLNPFLKNVSNSKSKPRLYFNPKCAVYSDYCLCSYGS